MLRSILVALDGSGSSVRASQVAIQLASQYGAHVEGLGIVNSGWIQRPEPVPIGGMALKVALDLSRLGTAKKRVDRVVENFRAQVANAGLPSHEVRSAEGNPPQLVANEARAHDLVALGRGTENRQRAIDALQIARARLSCGNAISTAFLRVVPQAF